MILIFAKFEGFGRIYYLKICSLDRSCKPRGGEHTCGGLSTLFASMFCPLADFIWLNVVATVITSIEQAATPKKTAKSITKLQNFTQT